MSDEKKIQRGKQWLEKLLTLMSNPATVTAHKSDNYHEETDNYWLTIDQTNLSPDQIDLLIGRDGEVIDAIQFLANSTLNINLEPEEHASYTIELDGYRLRREAELRSLAEEAVMEVRRTGREYEMKDLSSAERRQLHSLLKEYTDLETYSRGQEPDRRLVVRLR